MYRGAGNAWYPPPPSQDDDSPANGPAPPPLVYPGEAPPVDDYQQHDMQYAYYDQEYNPQLYYTPQQYSAPAAPPDSFPPQRADPPYATASAQLPLPPAAAGFDHYSTVQYAHDRMYSAVESARWTGELDSSPSFQHHHHSTTTTTTTSSSHSALGSYQHAHASQSGSGSDEAARRRSVASSTDSGDSPRVGALGLPIEVRSSLSPPPWLSLAVPS